MASAAQGPPRGVFSTGGKSGLAKSPELGLFWIYSSVALCAGPERPATSQGLAHLLYR